MALDGTIGKQIVRYGLLHCLQISMISDVDEDLLAGLAY